MSRENLLDALAPILDELLSLQLDDPMRARAELAERFPSEGEVLTKVRSLVRRGVEEGWLCDRENAGVRYSRVLKATGGGAWSIDAVHMRASGPAHTHPSGEVDLCFPVEGAPRFDGNTPGWTVYGPGSWHVPAVEGGVMDILYFLPGGAIRFEERPA